MCIRDRFYSLISKIFKKNNKEKKFLRFIIKSFSLSYLLFFSFVIFLIESNYQNLEIFLFFSIAVCIASDMGGLIVGKTIKGKKLTKISPNKTISGSVGSFIFSTTMIPLFKQSLDNNNIYLLILFTLIISLTSQLGDLFISFLKRKAKIIY